jgi:hypothetical protein
MENWYILWPWGLFYDHLVYFVAICYSRFGMLYQEKSGNPAWKPMLVYSLRAKKATNFPRVGVAFLQRCVYLGVGGYDLCAMCVWHESRIMKARLPDGLFSDQKSQFG